MGNCLPAGQGLTAAQQAQNVRVSDSPVAGPRVSAGVTKEWLDTVVPDAAEAGGVSSFEVEL